MAAMDAAARRNRRPASGAPPEFDLIVDHGAAVREPVALELLEIPAAGARREAPLLFVHGMFHGAWCWREHFMPFFAEHGYDTYAVSLRDHGRSGQTAGRKSWRLADYVCDVRWAMNQIGRKPILVGHSLGGSIVEKLLEEEDFPAVALLAPSPVGGSAGASMRMMRRHPGGMLRALARRDLSEALPAFVESFFSPEMPAEEVRRYAAMMVGQTSFEAAQDAYFSDCPKPSKKATPVLVLAAADDWSIPMAKHKALAEGWGSQLKIAPGAHDLMLDIGWREAAEMLLDWLNAVPARPPA